MTQAEYDELIDAVDALAADGNFGAVEQLCRRGMRRADDEQRKDLSCYLHEALIGLGRLSEAHDAAETCGRVVCRVYTRFLTWDLDGARRLLQGFCGTGEEKPYADYLRGMLAEFAGRDGRIWFERAAKAAPEHYWVPPVLSDRRARELCLRVIRSLPRPLRKALGRKPVYVLDVPVRRDVWPTLLGCEAHEAIEIYRLNIARYARDLGEAEEELRKTLLHEIGHAFGMEHRDLDRMGL